MNGSHCINSIICLGLRDSMMEEHLEIFPSKSDFVPKEGWALFERAPASRLNAEAKGFLVDLFNAGKANKNNRVSPESAELMLRDNFPSKQEFWLTVRQVSNAFISLQDFLTTKTT